MPDELPDFNFISHPIRRQPGVGRVGGIRAGGSLAAGAGGLVGSQLKEWDDGVIRGE